MKVSDLIASLTVEHAQILKILSVMRVIAERLEGADDLVPSDLLECLEFLEGYAGTFHHHKEELYLFPLLEHSGCTQGGPKCSFFMELYLNWNSAQQIAQMASEAKFKGHDYPLSLEMKQILNANSFLKIPIEEHQAGHLAIQMMKHGADAYLRSGVPDQSLIALMGLYISMLQTHIRKEEECLFVVGKNRISNEDVGEVPDSPERDRLLEIGARLVQKYL